MCTIPASGWFGLIKSYIIKYEVDPILMKDLTIMDRLRNVLRANSGH